MRAIYILLEVTRASNGAQPLPPLGKPVLANKSEPEDFRAHHSDLDIDVGQSSIEEGEVANPDKFEILDESLSPIKKK